MLLAEALQCPAAELGGEAGEAAELVRLQCEMSSPGECVQVLAQLHHSAWATADQPGNSAGTAASLGWGIDSMDHACSGISPVCPPGLKGAGAARAVLCWEHKEVCSIVGRRSQTCLAADKFALPSATFVSWQEWHHPGGKLVTPLLCLLASLSQLLNVLSLIIPSLSLSFTTINELATQVRGTLGHPWKTLNLSVLPLHTQLGASGSLKPANWKCEAERHVRAGNYSHWHSI